ncbi:hypothetical protein Enr13x_00740 [Stieleria neptunia]|uniref:Uncharacterized protein n=1 Tax=Stieleria neptunia TaxID=2527979 RepID=A0A518HHF4_9BACT|nr:hypothetical protein [Stieleria neptunia]QDV40268.1 hypothetical protein Enr13x_00740 [Stieleria neptunia]
MPWPTTNGLRTLRGAEADLVRGAIGMMVDHHVAELRDGEQAWAYGVQWFDQWDAGQRLWLLERVTSALLGRETIESSAAMFDAAADAIFYEINDLVQIEIEQGSAGDTDRSWRQSVIDALEFQTDRPTESVADNVDQVDRVDQEHWQTVITRIADTILGVRLYQRAERFRDADYKRTEAFLRDRGLPEDYLTQIPPLRTVDQTQWSIDRIQAYVFA